MLSQDVTNCIVVVLPISIEEIEIQPLKTAVVLINHCRWQETIGDGALKGQHETIEFLSVFWLVMDCWQIVSQWSM